MKVSVLYLKFKCIQVSCVLSDTCTWDAFFLQCIHTHASYAPLLPAGALSISFHTGTPVLLADLVPLHSPQPCPLDCFQHSSSSSAAASYSPCACFSSALLSFPKLIMWTWTFKAWCNCVWMCMRVRKNN